MSVEAKSKASLDLNNDTIKTIFNNWSKTQKMVPTNFGDMIQINNIQNKDYFEVTLYTKYEHRYIEYKSAPYDGIVIADNYKPPNMWDVRVKDEERKYSNAQTVVMPHSIEIGICPVCGGNGRYECPVCRGEKERTCIICRGKGEKECYSCGGTGTVRCSKCSGFGYLKYDETFGLGKAGDTCPECHGSGEIRCRSCSGNGYITCSECFGSGVTRCRACLGVGFIICKECGHDCKVMHFDLLNVDYQDDTITRSYMEAENLKLEDGAGCQVLLDYVPATQHYWLNEGKSAEEASAWGHFLDMNLEQKLTNLPAIDEKLVPQIRDMYILEDNEYKERRDCRRLYQALKILYTPISEIEYLYRDKPYNAWIYGENNFIYMDKAPNIVSDKISDVGRKFKKLFK